MVKITNHRYSMYLIHLGTITLNTYASFYQNYLWKKCILIQKPYSHWSSLYLVIWNYFHVDFVSLITGNVFIPTESKLKKKKHENFKNFIEHIQWDLVFQKFFFEENLFISSQIKNRTPERKVKIDWYAGFVVIVDDIGDWKLYVRNEEGKPLFPTFWDFCCW